MIQPDMQSGSSGKKTMKPHEASHTAEFQAGFRAIEAVRRPANLRLFNDPFSIAFLSAEPLCYVKLASIPFFGDFVRSIVEWRSAGAMSSGIARTRLIDDWLLDALKRGVSQIVLLGAGYDCRAYRLSELSGCHIVEIDHPATQAAKKEHLQDLLGSLPPNVTYISADLTEERLEEVFGRNGLKCDTPLFILWEGVAHYLEESAVDATIRSLSSICVTGSILAFTYLHCGLLDGSLTFERAHVAQASVARGSEPWIWGIDPARLPDYLAERGFKLRQDIGAEDYRKMYWRDEARRYRGFGFYHAALAERVTVDGKSVAE